MRKPIWGCRSSTSRSGRERARLAEDLLGDRELADIVQAAGEAEELDLGPRAAPMRAAIRAASSPTRRNARPCRRRARRRARARPAAARKRPAGRARSRAGGARRARARRAGRASRCPCRRPSTSRARCRRRGRAPPVDAVVGVRRDSRRRRSACSPCSSRWRRPGRCTISRSRAPRPRPSREEQRELVAAEPERLAALRRRAATCASTSSPTGMAVPVVDVLEVVESSRQRLSGVPRSSAPVESRWSRSWKWRWLPSPVSGSVSASRIALSASWTERW